MFKIEVANRIVLIDPWLDENPTSPIKASEITEADIAIPMHYKTFPVLAQSADEFVKNVEEKMPEVNVVVLKP